MPGGNVLAVFVDDPDLGPARRAPGGPGGGAQVLRGGDRRPGDLRRAVEVVEVVPEGVHPLRRQLARKRGAARGGDPQRREVVLREHIVGKLEDPLHHHRDDDERRGPGLLDRLERVLGVELAPQHVGRAEREPEREVREAPGVKERRRDYDGLVNLERDLREQRGERPQRVGLGALRALRGAGRPRGQDHEAARLLGAVEIGVVVVLDQILEARVVGALGAGVAPCDEALDLLARVGKQPGELVVVDQRHRALALDDLRELGRREPGVHVERVRPQLRQRQRRLDEAMVVAGHDRDAVALADPGVAKAPRQRVGAPVQLTERVLAGIVDDRGLVGTGDLARRRVVGSGDQFDPHLGVGVDYIPGIDHANEHLGAEGVLGLRTIHDQGEDVTVAFNQEIGGAGHREIRPHLRRK